jgi:DNA-binding GntR family transcriptional regulator
VKIKADTRPLYLRAEQALCHLIRGPYQRGHRLPPEPTLAQHLGIFHSTLREAPPTFEVQLLITGRQGVGTFVNMACEVIESGLDTLVSLDSLARDRGLPCTTEIGPSNRSQQARESPTD